MTEESNSEWLNSMILLFREGSLNESLNAMLSLSYYDSERSRVELLLRSAIEPGNDPEVRRLAITCLGHVARIHGAIDDESVEKLKTLQTDPELSGTVEDALGDIWSYAKE